MATAAVSPATTAGQATRPDLLFKPAHTKEPPTPTPETLTSHDGGGASRLNERMGKGVEKKIDRTFCITRTNLKDRKPYKLPGFRKIAAS